MQVRVLVDGHRVAVAGGGTHHDKIVDRAGLVEGRGEFVGAVGLVLLLVAESDEAHRAAGRQTAAEGLQEEATDLFEVAYEVASGALAGGGIEFEVGGVDFQPGIVCGGRQAEGKDETGDAGPPDARPVTPETGARTRWISKCIRPRASTALPDSFRWFAGAGSWDGSG